MTDILRLRNMTFRAHVGTLPEERVVGQKVEVDLECHLDLQPAGLSDDLKDGIDYAGVCKLVGDITRHREYRLLEKLAEEIAGRVLVEYPAETVRVTVRKPLPPVDVVLDSVEVEITRSRTVKAPGA